MHEVISEAQEKNLVKHKIWYRMLGSVYPFRFSKSQAPLDAYKSILLRNKCVSCWYLIKINK
jgi:hypothetical protein